MPTLDIMNSFLRVSCLAKAEQVAKEHRAEIVISLLDPDVRPGRFADVAELRRHEALYFYDQESVLPQGMEQAVEALIDLAKKWRGLDVLPRVVLHCHAGVSRSTAAAYVILNILHPDCSPEENFAQLLRLTRKPWPNYRLVAVADGMLNRGGELLKPLDAYREQYSHRIDVYRRFNRRRGIADKVKR